MGAKESRRQSDLPPTPPGTPANELSASTTEEFTSETGDIIQTPVPERDLETEAISLVDSLPPVEPIIQMLYESNGLPAAAAAAVYPSASSVPRAADTAESYIHPGATSTSSSEEHFDAVTESEGDALAEPPLRRFPSFRESEIPPGMAAVPPLETDVYQQQELQSPAEDISRGTSEPSVASSMPSATPSFNERSHSASGSRTSSSHTGRSGAVTLRAQAERLEVLRMAAEIAAAQPPPPSSTPSIFGSSINEEDDREMSSKMLAGMEGGPEARYSNFSLMHMGCETWSQPEENQTEEEKRISDEAQGHRASAGPSMSGGRGRSAAATMPVCLEGVPPTKEALNRLQVDEETSAGLSFPFQGSLKTELKTVSEPIGSSRFSLHHAHRHRHRHRRGSHLKKTAIHSVHNHHHHHSFRLGMYALQNLDKYISLQRNRSEDHEKSGGNGMASALSSRNSSPSAAGVEESSFLISDEQAARRHILLTSCCNMGISALNCLTAGRLPHDTPYSPEPVDWADISSAKAIMFFERSQHGPPVWHRGPHGPGGLSGFMIIRLPPDQQPPPSLVGLPAGHATSAGPHLPPPPRVPTDSADEFSSAAEDPDIDVAEGIIDHQPQDHVEAPAESTRRVHAAYMDMNQDSCQQPQTPSTHGEAPPILTTTTGHWSPPLFFTEGTVPEDFSIGFTEDINTLVVIHDETLLSELLSCGPSGVLMGARDLVTQSAMQGEAYQGPSDSMTAKDKAAIEGIENLRLEDEAALEGQDLISAEPHQRLPSSSLTALTEVDGQYVIVPLHGAVFHLDQDKNSLLYPVIQWSSGGLEVGQEAVIVQKEVVSEEIVPEEISVASALTSSRPRTQMPVLRGHGLGACLPAWLESCFGPTPTADDSTTGPEGDGTAPPSKRDILPEASLLSEKPLEQSSSKECPSERLMRHAPGQEWWRKVASREICAPEELHPLYVALDRLEARPGDQ